ncbi:hypothetical protein QMM92_19730 [Leptospira santarosai]|nr:hypothetical protein [Leptospira santarosai]MDI7226907.1 hypothetical protein [Leptospira santarosai]
MNKITSKVCMAGADKASEEVSLSDFLESYPPSQFLTIKNLYRVSKDSYGLVSWVLLCPELRLHCSSEACNGMRFFRCTNNYILKENEERTLFLTYQCSNCQKSPKLFSLFLIAQESQKGKAYKFGELPLYGSPTPSKLIKLIGPDREVFLKGRQCENQGLGIGAFIYYRRVVENQKNRILTEIKKVAQKTGLRSEKYAIFDDAIKETQFSRAIDLVKDALPESLLIDGRDPLKLLHGALSEGVHNHEDEECLEIAHSIRIVLAELSERISIALKDENELKNAINLLDKRKSK